MTTIVVETLDPAWKGLYKAGGIAFIIAAISVLVEFIIFALGPSTNGIVEQITSFSLNPLLIKAFIWLFVSRATLLIIAFSALFFALRNINRTYSFIAMLLAVIGLTSIIAVNSTMIYAEISLGSAYASATTDSQRSALAAAATLADSASTAALALAEGFFSAVYILFSLVMLRGPFPKLIAYFGIIFGLVVLAAEILGGLGGSFSVASTVDFLTPVALIMIWGSVVGYRLYKLGKRIPVG